MSSPVTLIAFPVLGNHNIGGKGTVKAHLDSRGTLFRFKVCDRYALYPMRIYFAALSGTVKYTQVAQLLLLA